MFLFFTQISLAGDFAYGKVKYGSDFGAIFTTYSISEADNEWINSLVSNFNYKGKVVRFVKTNLVLNKSGEKIIGEIYQSIKNPDRFYVVKGDVMLNLKEGRISSPGTGGFSVHAPKSMNFIACLNCEMGVPYSYWSHSSIGYKEFWWKANGNSRL